jgi:hypothetical protein
VVAVVVAIAVSVAIAVVVAIDVISHNLPTITLRKVRS